MPRYTCDVCYKSFRSLGGLGSHKNTHVSRKKTVSPSNPFFAWLRKTPKLSSEAIPAVVEVDHTQITRPQPMTKRRAWTESDIKIPSELIPLNADTRSPQYREAIRKFYDEQCKTYPNLTMKAFAEANVGTITVRQFQKWCTDEKRSSDKKIIKESMKQEPVKKRHGYKEIFQGARIRFTNEQKYKLLKEFDELREENPNFTAEDFARMKPKLISSTFRNWTNPNARAQIERDAKHPWMGRMRWDSSDYAARARANNPNQEDRLRVEWTVALAEEEKCDSTWFRFVMARIMKEMKRFGWVFVIYEPLVSFTSQK